MRPLLSRFSDFLAARGTRELLAWCLPALLLGFALRLLLTIHMPFAYYHDDAPDVLVTADHFLTSHRFELHEKKTFLVPVLFALAFALPVPAAITIPLAQHVLGLGLTVLVGALCRRWLVRWKLWIVPLTALTAANPFFIWFEHTLMAETVFIFCTVFLAYTGTVYAQRPARETFAFLVLALVLVAAARPEGKLLFGFGLLLVGWMHAGAWRTHWLRFATLVAVAVAMHFATPTTQGGLLLYTSVARLTPPELKCAPGFEPLIAPIKNNLQNRWLLHPQFPVVKDRKAISFLVKQYLAGPTGNPEKISSLISNCFCLKLAKETCLKNFFALPGLALTKFRLECNNAPTKPLDNLYLFSKQRDGFLDNFERTKRLAPGLLGVRIHDPAALDAWMNANYGEVRWFDRFTDRWLAAVNALRLPDKIFEDQFVYRGVPLYFVGGTLGLLAVMFRRSPTQRFHIAWGLTLVGFFFVIMLTANVRSRFRIVFEPFWFIYFALLAETLWRGFARLFKRGAPKADAVPVEASE